MPFRVLVAGATGAVGSELVDLLRGAGHFVRALSRDPERSRKLAPRVDEVRLGDPVANPASIAGVCDGIDVVVSCLGAPVTMNLTERRSFSRLDVAANLALLADAKRAGVKRFVYLACHTEPGFVHTRYVRAHERVAAAIAASGLDYTIVRPTGIYSAFADLLSMANKGPLPLIGDGKTETNPIHPHDVALGVLSVLASGPRDLPLGGPDTMSRTETLALAFAALGKPARFRRVPPFVMRFVALLLTWFHPRLSELIEFFAAVSTSRSLAPTVGTRRLSDYYRDLAARVESARATEMRDRT